MIVNDLGGSGTGGGADKAPAQEVVDLIKSEGGEAAPNFDSVADYKAATGMIEQAIDTYGRIDIVVNNAGILRDVIFHKMTEDDWDSIMAVHLKGHFSCIKAAVPEMIKQKSGRIINISSRAAAYTTLSLAYSTAKAGILGFTSMLSAEQKENGITVNAILPGAKTKLFPLDVITHMPGLPPKQRLGPEYVAPLFVYLATDEAKDISGRFFYIGSGDFYIFARLLRMPGGSHTTLYKTGPWTVDELTEVVPPLLGNG